MEYIPAIFISLFLLLILTRPLTVLLHELGHALPAIFFTKQNTTIYIGSYGDANFCFRILLPKLEIYLRYNPINWRGGMCISQSDNIIVLHKFISVLCGPIFSLITTIICVYLTLYTDLHGFIKIIFVIIGSSSILSFFVDIFPRKLIFENGDTLYSDGYILELLRPDFQNAL